MKTSKKIAILNVLLKKKRITNVEALMGVHKVRTHKLSSIISELKKEGHVIEGYKITGLDGEYLDFIYKYKGKI